jgi:1-acyl-sn-glycerol-3-phosphate acyltransferase
MSPPLVYTILTLALVSATIAVLVWVKRGPEDSALVATVRFFSTIVMRVVHRVRLYDETGEPIRDALPSSGAFIIVANHRSGCDPNLVAATTMRWIVFLMAREYYEIRGLQWMFRRLDCVPVNRDGNDFSATRRALTRLHEGRVICIFPQGGIRESEEFAVAKAGVALLASKTDVPVIPLYIDGSPLDDSVFRSLFIPSRSRLYRGAPLRFVGDSQKPRRADLEAFGQRIVDAIAQLKRIASQPPNAVEKSSEREEARRDILPESSSNA